MEPMNCTLTSTVVIIPPIQSKQPCLSSAIFVLFTVSSCDVCGVDRTSSLSNVNEFGLVLPCVWPWDFRRPVGGSNKYRTFASVEKDRRTVTLRGTKTARKSTPNTRSLFSNFSVVWGKMGEMGGLCTADRI